MPTSEIVALIGSIGFPIVVAWYCLTKLNKTMEENTKAINALTQVVTKLCEQHDNTKNTNPD